MIVCKICGGRVADEVACCARCFTPHHYDCWTFAGQCSIYACGGREHRYFDFREQSEAAVLAAIGSSLAVALQVEPSPGPAGASEPTKVDDLMAYKRGLFRNLQAVLAKVAPGVTVGADLVDRSLEEELGEGAPRLFLADDLEIDETGRSQPDLGEKRRLLRSLAASNEASEGLSVWRRIKDSLAALWRGRGGSSGGPP